MWLKWRRWRCIAYLFQDSDGSKKANKRLRQHFLFKLSAWFMVKGWNVVTIPELPTDDMLRYCCPISSLKPSAYVRYPTRRALFAVCDVDLRNGICQHDLSYSLIVCLLMQSWSNEIIANYNATMVNPLNWDTCKETNRVWKCMHWLILNMPKRKYNHSCRAL